MTTTALQVHIGQVYRWAPHPAVRVEMRCIDARVAYGKVQLCIEPVSGSGFCWVDLASLQATES